MACFQDMCQVILAQVSMAMGLVEVATSLALVGLGASPAVELRYASLAPGIWLHNVLAGGTLSRL